MRIVLLCNNYVGYESLKWLLARNENIVGLVLHTDENARYKKEILSLIKGYGIPVWEGPQLDDDNCLRELSSLNPNLFLSILFGYILKPDVISIPTKGCINIHNGYLPFNKGTFANVWSIVDQTPAGATMHYIDEGIDTGRIISRKEVRVLPEDTGKTLYERIEKACLALLKESWPQISAAEIHPIDQDPTEGSAYTKKDVEKIDFIDLDKNYRARDLINILRARTFPPYKGAFFEEKGQKYFLSLSIEKE